MNNNEFIIPEAICSNCKRTDTDSQEIDFGVTTGECFTCDHVRGRIYAEVSAEGESLIWTGEMELSIVISSSLINPFQRWADCTTADAVVAAKYRWKGR